MLRSDVTTHSHDSQWLHHVYLADTFGVLVHHTRAICGVLCARTLWSACQGFFTAEEPSELCTVSMPRAAIWRANSNTIR